MLQIQTPEELVRILKRENILRAWITLGRRRLMIQTAKNLYSDEIVAYSLTQDGKAVIVLKCGAVLRVGYYVQGRTMFLEDVVRVDDVIAL